MTKSSYILYKTQTCGRCPLAVMSMSRAGVDYEEVYLDADEHADTTEGLRTELGVNVLSVPMVRTPDGRVLRDLAAISEEFRDMGKVA